MTDDNTLVPEYKIYKDKNMYAVAFFGGPLAAGYMIAQNFKTFGDQKKYKLTIYITLAFFIIMFSALFFADGAEHIPKYIIPITYSAVAYGLMRMYQGEQIDNHIKNGGQTYRGGNLILVSLVSLVVTAAVIIIPILVFSQNEKIENYTYTFKGQNNEVEYYADHVTKTEVVALCDHLATTDFLDSTYQQFFAVDKVNETYQLKIPSNNNMWQNVESVTYLKKMRDYLQQFYTNKKLTIVICDSLYAVKKTIE